MPRGRGKRVRKDSSSDRIKEWTQNSPNKGYKVDAEKPKGRNQRSGSSTPKSTRKRAKLDRQKEKSSKIGSNGNYQGEELTENDGNLQNISVSRSNRNQVQQGQPDADHQGDHLAMVEFQEGEDLIEMRVDASEFPSENKETSSEEELAEEAEIEAQNQLFEQAEDKQIGKEDEQRGHIFVCNPEFQGVQSLTEEDKEDRIVNKTVARLQELMVANGYMRGPPPQNIAGEIEVDSEINFNLNANVNRSITNHSQGMDKVVRTNPTTQMNAEIGAQAIPATSVETSNSDATLYQTAVQPGSNRSPNVVVQNKVSTEPNQNKPNRRSSGWGMSSSDEDQVNTSDEFNGQINILFNSLCSHNFSAGNRQDEPVPTTSNGRGDREIRSRNNTNQDGRRLTPPVLTIQQRVDNLIRDAENAKVKINDVQGTNKVVNFSYDNDPTNDLQNKLMHSAMVDKDYLVIAAHVDESVAKKIRGGNTLILPRFFHGIMSRTNKTHVFKLSQCKMVIWGVPAQLTSQV